MKRTDQQEKAVIPAQKFAENHKTPDPKEARSIIEGIILGNPFINKRSCEVTPETILRLEMKFVDMRGDIWRVTFEETNGFEIKRSMFQFYESDATEEANLLRLTRAFVDAKALNEQIKVREVRSLFIRFVSTDHKKWEFDILPNWLKKADDLGWCHLDQRVAPC